ncbi:uncharacterized protein LOC108098369 [Drosophila ficusphila]|uniref:uncharacterized protein LOC108098369 n=1 Tax=Drosophila ficusphila TaxID=30025 RepID=UPI0007E75277|nr:uncharacterized protein LOC108098369 [Drosophila ficusphila]
MANRITWTFLFAFAALQSSYAASTVNRRHLVLKVLDELSQMLTANKEKYKNVFQLVIDEAELTLPTESQGSILPKLKELIRRIDSVDNDDFIELRNLGDALEEIKKTLELSESKEFESAADKVIVKLYIKHGVDLKVILDKNLETTLKVIEKKMESDMGTWSESRLARNSELVKLFNEFKNEKDIDKKSEKIYNILDKIYNI